MSHTSHGLAEIHTHLATWLFSYYLVFVFNNIAGFDQLPLYCTVVIKITAHSINHIVESPPRNGGT